MVALSDHHDCDHEGGCQQCHARPPDPFELETAEPVLSGGEVSGLEDGLSQEEVEEGGDVGLDDEEEVFFSRDVEEGVADDGLRRVGPDSGTNEVRVPWSGGHDSNEEEESETVSVNAGSERVKER